MRVRSSCAVSCYKRATACYCLSKRQESTFGALWTLSRLLVVDERLDRETGEVVMDLLFDLHRRSGTTMLLISHDPVLAERCDRVVTLADGRIAGDRQTGE